MVVWLVDLLFLEIVQAMNLIILLVELMDVSVGGGIGILLVVIPGLIDVFSGSGIDFLYWGRIFCGSLPRISLWDHT